MGSIKFDNLDDSPINFDLSEEDLKSIKGGTGQSDFKFNLNSRDYKLKDIKIDIIVKIECYGCSDDHIWPWHYPVKFEGEPILPVAEPEENKNQI